MRTGRILRAKGGHQLAHRDGLEARYGLDDPVRIERAAGGQTVKLPDDPLARQRPFEEAAVIAFFDGHGAAIAQRDGHRARHLFRVAPAIRVEPLRPQAGHQRMRTHLHPPQQLLHICCFFNIMLIFQHHLRYAARMARAKPKLSRREQEVLDIVYARGHATAAEVREDMEAPPTDAAVRTTLRILVAKGHLRIAQDGPRYDYWPTVARETARRSELRHLLRTFFGGSTESALAALLDLQPGELTDDARRRLKKLIDKTARQGR